ncbi:hypothetical protein NXC24_PB00168 (plasmid) [Rhizobium sp. NXC24]|nr:hypothetical protein NXC24_PB00168 [Rhizobium sp. NXC24]
MIPLRLLHKIKRFLMVGLLARSGRDSAFLQMTDPVGERIVKLAERQSERLTAAFWGLGGYGGRRSSSLVGVGRAVPD